MVCSASVRHRRHLQDLCRELSWSGSSAPHPGGGTNDSQRYFGGLSAAVRDFVRAKTEGGTMSEQTRVRHPLYNLLPADVEGFDSLLELAVESCHRRGVAAAGSGTVGSDASPVRCPADSLPGEDPARARRSGLPQEDRCTCAVQEASGGGACVVSATSSRGAPDLCGVFQHGIHVERSSS